MNRPSPLSYQGGTGPGAYGAPGPDRGAALSLCEITKRFGSLYANRDVSLQVAPGEIHALLGENGAGKTTLMRVAAGVYEPDEGHVEVAGRRVSLRKPEHALRAGIGMVHQHFTLVPTLTAVENVAMRPAALPRRSHLRAVEEEMRELCQQLGFEVDPGRTMADAPVAERQRVEIIKLLRRSADVLIFDEPSAVLSPPEWEEFAKLLGRLAEAGKAVLLITHKISEILSVAQRYTVLRDGAVSGSGAIAGVGREQLVEEMVGRAVKPRAERVRGTPGAPVLAVRGLSVAAERDKHASHMALRDVSLEVRGGEILGLAGVAGSGQDELIEALLGLRPAVGGEVELGGEPFSSRSPAEFYARGGAYIPEDRHSAAIADELPVWRNLLMREVVRGPIARHGLIRNGAARARAKELVERFDVRAPSVDAHIRQLSGGNQQKVIVARELAGEPRLVIAVQPTRGLDVKATEFVHEQLIARKVAGAGVLLLSLDLDEILALSDRVAVIGAGRIQGMLEAESSDPLEVGRLMVRTGEGR